MYTVESIKNDLFDEAVLKEACQKAHDTFPEHLDIEAKVQSDTSNAIDILSQIFYVFLTDTTVEKEHKPDTQGVYTYPEKILTGDRVIQKHTVTYTGISTLKGKVNGEDVNIKIYGDADICNVKYSVVSFTLEKTYNSHFNGHCAFRLNSGTESAHDKIDFYTGKFTTSVFYLDLIVDKLLAYFKQIHDKT
jgi:hypothetical protein|nr:MAG TPA: hypothetical protein [Caudoviricetes sp.]